jgi:hypothetical protein
MDAMRCSSRACCSCCCCDSAVTAAAAVFAPDRRPLLGLWLLEAASAAAAAACRCCCCCSCCSSASTGSPLWCSSSCCQSSAVITRSASFWGSACENLQQMACRRTAFGHVMLPNSHDRAQAHVDPQTFTCSTCVYIQRVGCKSMRVRFRIRSLTSCPPAAFVDYVRQRRCKARAVGVAGAQQRAHGVRQRARCRRQQRLARHAR